MKLKKTKRDFYTLADMHSDGVRFDPKVLAAKKQQQGILSKHDNQDALPQNHR